MQIEPYRARVNIKCSLKLGKKLNELKNLFTILEKKELPCAIGLRER